jgi:hypothetical protein
VRPFHSAPPSIRAKNLDHSVHKARKLPAHNADDGRVQRQGPDDVPFGLALQRVEHDVRQDGAKPEVVTASTSITALVGIGLEVADNLQLDRDGSWSDLSRRCRAGAKGAIVPTTPSSNASKNNSPSRTISASC